MAMSVNLQAWSAANDSKPRRAERGEKEKKKVLKLGMALGRVNAYIQLISSPPTSGVSKHIKQTMELPVEAKRKITLR